MSLCVSIILSVSPLLTFSRYASVSLSLSLSLCLSLSLTQTHAHTSKHTHKHTHTHKYTQKHTHKYTYKHTHKHTHKHTQINKPTHILICLVIRLFDSVSLSYHLQYNYTKCESANVSEVLCYDELAEKQNKRHKEKQTDIDR